jgi:NAD(P)-dependent dehydrogenase (short-subunit alcohol dehydrogenase family)
VVVITGANTGIGLELVKQLVYHETKYIVILTSRDRKKGEAAVHSLDPMKYYADRLKYMQLDVSSQSSIGKFVNQILKTDKGVDVLVNNARTNPEGWDFGPKAKFPIETAELVLGTNFFGAVHLTEALLPHMNSGGHVVNITSKLGRLREISNHRTREILTRSDMTFQDLMDIANGYLDSVRVGDYKTKGWPAHNYIVSKVLLNIYSQELARRLQGRIRVNAVCPGRTKTKFGGLLAPKSVVSGAKTPLKLVKSTDTGSGQFWEDEQVSSFY